MKPKKLIEESTSIINFKPDTLGSKGKHEGKIVSRTKIQVECSYCEETWWCSWSNHKRRKNEVCCFTCTNQRGIAGMKGRSHSEKFKEKRRKMMKESNPMNDPENRKKISEKLKGRDVEWLAGENRPEHSKKKEKHMKRVMNPDNDSRNDYREKK